MKHTINLTEALCGFQFSIQHLDGRNILFKTQPGEVIEPGERKKMSTFFIFSSKMFIFVVIVYFCFKIDFLGAIRGIPNEGMPKFKYPETKGNLYVRFEVEFPQPHFKPEIQIKVIENFSVFCRLGRNIFPFQMLEKFLPHRPKHPTQIPTDHEEVSLMPFEDYHAAHEGQGRGK